MKKLRPAGLVNGASEVSFEVPGSVGGAPCRAPCAWTPMGSSECGWQVCGG